MATSKISTFPVIVFAWLLLLACETDPILFEGPYHVRFSNESETLRESHSKIINVQVHVVGPAPDENLTVRYTISGNAREGVDYVIVGERGELVIPKDKYFGNIQVQLINNSNNIIRSQDIVFKLTGTADGDVQVGQGKSNLGDSFTLTILDDCILGGTYKGVRSSFSIPVEGIQVTSQDCETYQLSNWNVDFFNTPFEMDLVFIDNADNTLTIPEQEEDLFPTDLATIMGTGTVDPSTRVMEFTVILVDFEGQPELTFKLIPD
ncbi:MAG TPA: hypothetical protein VEB86_15480 [Chryseosolibacter sp.]|nr:hypothetical protein [Chryseosolibacter sp.]